MPHWLIVLLLISWPLYMAILGVWIVMQRSEPVATLGWLLALAALPYVGFLVYYVLGPQRIKRQRLRRAKAKVALPPADGAVEQDEAHELVRLARKTTGLPITTATAAQLLVDGAATYDALLAEIHAARHQIHLEYYIYSPDATGTLIRDALTERARNGVVVRLLLDAVGSSHCPQRFFAPLLAAGGELA